MNDDDGIGAISCYRADESIAFSPGRQVVPVTFVAVDSDIAFTGVGIDEGKADRCLLRCGGDEGIIEIVEDPL